MTTYCEESTATQHPMDVRHSQSLPGSQQQGRSKGEGSSQCALISAQGMLALNAQTWTLAGTPVPEVPTPFRRMGSGPPGLERGELQGRRDLGHSWACFELAHSVFGRLRLAFGLASAKFGLLGWL